VALFDRHKGTASTPWLTRRQLRHLLPRRKLLQPKLQRQSLLEMLKLRHLQRLKQKEAQERFQQKVKQLRQTVKHQ